MPSGVEPQSAGFLSLEAYHEAIDQLLDRSNAVKGARSSWDCHREVCIFPLSMLKSGYVGFACRHCRCNFCPPSRLSRCKEVSPYPRETDFLCLDFPNGLEDASATYAAMFAGCCCLKQQLMSVSVDEVGQYIYLSAPRSVVGQFERTSSRSSNSWYD